MADTTTSASTSPAKRDTLEVAGYAGGPLAIYGKNLGKKGVLTVRGRPLEITAWYEKENSGGNFSVKSFLPKEIDSGPVELINEAGEHFSGYLNKRS